MGNQRLLIETALRDAVLLLHRDQVPSASIARVVARFADLQRDYIESENLKGATGASHYLAKDAAAEVMSTMLDRLFNVDIPTVTVRRLEEELHTAHAQLEMAQKERAEALANVEEMKVKERRHTDAHTYALHCYFREVFQLRQTIGIASTPMADIPGSSMSPRGGALERATSLLQGLTSSSPARHTPLSRSKESLVDPKLTVVIPVAPANASFSSSTTGGMQSVVQAYHTDAIFDYEKYLDLQRSDDMAWEAKYQQLNEDFTAYMNQVEKDRAFNEKQHQMLIKVHQDRYNSLQRRLEDELKRQQAMKLLVQAAVRQMAEERKQVKNEVHHMQTSMAEYSREVSRRIGCVGDYNQVLVDFVKAACKYMSERQTAQEGSKLEEITRFRFQRSLVPAPTDTQNLREAKMFWRRHDVSRVLFATVMDHRQNVDERAELLASVAELRQTVKQLHQENHDLVTSQASYGFVGLQSLLQAAATRSPQATNTASLSMLATTPETTTDDPLASSAPPNGHDSSLMGVQIVNEKAATPLHAPPQTYLAVPAGAMWMLSHPMPSAVLPSASTDALPSENVLYLRTKLSPDEVDTFASDRLFTHRVFACGRDPSYYLRDDDRQTILRAWRAHKALVHQRNQLVFRHVDLRRMHRNLVAYHNALANETSRLASLTDGTLALARPDVLAMRENVQHLAEYEEEAELNYHRKRQGLESRIQKNLEGMYQTLERHVAMTLRGIFPASIRAHHVLAPYPPDPPGLQQQAQMQQQQIVHGGALSRIPTTKSLARRGSSKSSTGMSWQTSVEMPAGTVTVSTQTTFPMPGLGEARRPVPPWASSGARKDGDPGAQYQDQSGAQRGAHSRFLLQSTNQFSTTEEQDDDASSFFRVESLAPPRCIAIPTLGGLGPPALNDMSIKLLTRTSLMTTSTQLRKVLEDSVEVFATAGGNNSSRPSSTSPRTARPGSGAVVTTAARTGGFRVGSAASSRPSDALHQHQRPPSGSTARDRDALSSLPHHQPPSRGTSAAVRQGSATSPRSVPPAPLPSRLLSAAAARVTTLPPSVYTATTAEGEL